jgi:hypothetical protein
MSNTACFLFLSLTIAHIIHFLHCIYRHLSMGLVAYESGVFLSCSEGKWHVGQLGDLHVKDGRTSFSLDCSMSTHRRHVLLPCSSTIHPAPLCKWKTSIYSVWVTIGYDFLIEENHHMQMSSKVCSQWIVTKWKNIKFYWLWKWMLRFMPHHTASRVV